MLVAVIDTNVPVSAAISAKGPPAGIVKAWKDGSFVWITSPPLLDELSRVIRSVEVRPYLRLASVEIDELLGDLHEYATVVAPSRTLEVVVRDPDDNRVLEAAVEAQADYIVTGDQDLLALGSFEGTEIVTPVRFVAVLSAGAAEQWG